MLTRYFSRLAHPFSELVPLGGAETRCLGAVGATGKRFPLGRALVRQLNEGRPDGGEQSAQPAGVLEVGLRRRLEEAKAAPRRGQRQPALGQGLPQYRGL